MTIDTIFFIIGAASLAALYHVWRIFNAKGDGHEIRNSAELPVSRQELSKLDEQRVTFQAISQLWARSQIQKVKFADIARIWRDISQTEKPAPRTIEFKHEELMRFYQVQVKKRPFFTGQVLDATLDLLELLDKHGDCPSVVNRHNEEQEKYYDANTYTVLARTPLYLHSINVAEEAIRRVSKGALVPKAVLAALAHDMGKFPAFYDRFYHSGTHAFAGIAVMETLPSVKSLKYFEEIAAAVRNHHLQSEEYLDNVLRDSDQAARRGEISSLAAEALSPDQDKSKATVVPEQGKEPLKPGASYPSGNVATSKDLLGTGAEVRRRVARKLIDISEWFEPERFIRDLLKIVNTAQEGEKFWSALELDGYVYVKPWAFWQVIARHANTNARVRAAAASEQDRDDTIYSVVMQLKGREKTIATEFLGEGYFGAVFMHNPKGAGEKQTELYLIPFRAEAFGDNINNAARKKTVLMRNTTALVPKQHIGKKG